MKKSSLLIILALIVVFAVALRFYKLSDVPVGFHIDEASLSYNAYSLLLTGKDDNGNPYPLYVDMFGDNRPSGYHYLTILPVKFLGLTEFATRFPAALFGSLSVLALYALAWSIFKSSRIALLSAFLLTISPWHIVLSRASGEAVVALFFILLGFAGVFSGVFEKKQGRIILGGVLLASSFFLYHTPRLFVPLLFFIFILYWYPQWKTHARKLKTVLLAVFVGISLVSLSLIFLISGGTGRFSQVNIFKSFETDFLQAQQIQEDAIAGSPWILSRLVHNKPTNVGLIFLANYTEYFSPGFLFIKGGLPIWYLVPRMGLVYIVLLPFLIYGIYRVIVGRNKRERILLLWLLVAPIVPAITMDDVPNINRAVAMLPALEILAAVGLVSLATYFSNKKRAIVAGVLSALLLLNLGYFLHQYYFNARVHNPWYRNNGFKEMMGIVDQNYDNYEQVVMSKFQGGIYPLVLFYLRYDPAIYQNEGSPKHKDYGGFGKFVFVPQDCPSIQSTESYVKKQKVLYVDKGDCPDDKTLKFRKHEYVSREDGTKAFRIVYE